MELIIGIIIVLIIFYLIKEKHKKIEKNSFHNKKNLKTEFKTMNQNKHPIKFNTSLPENFKLTGEFKEIYEVMENTSSNLFITGKAGSGKSTLLEYFRMNSKKNFVILAPTGIAAIKAQGSTIHSFFLFPPSILLENEIEENKNKKLRRVINKADTILIDECSMIRADILDGINKSLKINRKISKPFGGLQIILIGDLFQLPPVVTGDEITTMERLYPKGNYFFNSNCYEKSDFTTYELNKVFRQKDEDFIHILNQIRIAKIKPEDLEIINKRVVNSDFELPEKTIVLSPTNRRVDLINNTNLNKIDSKAFTYTAKIEGKFKEEPVDEQLELKIGAQVMIVKNDTSYPKRYVNGSICIISELSDNSIKVLLDDEEIDIWKNVWERITYSVLEGKIHKDVVGSFIQYPIKLAWAVTIHKSQGQTFNNVYLDLDTGAFSHGQTYVALSRSTTLEGLYFKRKIYTSDIIFDDKIYNFILNNKKNKYETEIKTEEQNYKQRIETIRSQYLNAYYPWNKAEEEKLIEYYEKNLPIEDIAKILQRQPSALKGKLEKLGLIKDRENF